jgi:predicted RNA binding protein YcfA (HicA-like mRNA interferase family)
VKSVTGAQFCRALARAGWALARIRGSHQTWSKKSHPNVTVPVHAGQSLGRGLQAALMKAAGLSEEDL